MPRVSRLLAAPLRTLLATLLLALIVWALGSRFLGESAVYSVWADRDFARSLDARYALPTAGAELSNGIGARIPGGMQYVLLLPSVLWEPSALGQYRWVVFLEMLAAMILGSAVARRAGALGGLAAAAVWVVSPVATVTMRQTWNPSLLPIGLALAWWGLLRAVMARDARGLPALAAGLLLSAQMHLAVLPFGIALLPLLVWRRPQGVRRQLPRIGLAFAALYGPHLWSEVTSGWPNTQALLLQPDLGPLAPDSETWTPTLAQIGGGFQLLRDVPPAIVEGALAPLGVLGLVWIDAPLWIGALGLMSSPRERSLERGVIAGLVVAGLSLFILGLDTKIDLHAFRAERYVYPALSGVAVATGFTLAVWRRRPWIQLALTSIVVVALGAQAVQAERTRFRSPPASLTIPRLHAVLDLGAELLDTSVEKVAARTALLHWGNIAEHGIAGILQTHGVHFPGAQAPPCLAVSTDPAALTQEGIEEKFGYPLPGFQPITTVKTPGGDHVLKYAFDGPACRSTMVQKYVSLPTEAALEALETDPTAPIDLPAPPNALRRIAFFGAGHRMALDLAQRDGQIEATLHSHSLRGWGWTDSAAMTNRTLDAPRLIFEQDGSTTTLLFADQVGAQAVPTPIRASAAVGAGTWSLTLVWDAVRIDRGIHVSREEGGAVTLDPAWVRP